MKNTVNTNNWLFLFFTQFERAGTYFSTKNFKQNVVFFKAKLSNIWTGIIKGDSYFFLYKDAKRQKEKGQPSICPHQVLIRFQQSIQKVLCRLYRSQRRGELRWHTVNNNKIHHQHHSLMRANIVTYNLLLFIFSFCFDNWKLLIYSHFLYSEK